MFEILTRMLKPEIHVRSVDELRSGPVIVHGILRKPDPVLVTPFRSARCAAYDYTAVCVIKVRQGYAQQTLKHAVVYTPFELELQGGTVRAVPKKTDPPMSPAEHRELQSSGREGFAAVEETILPGRHVTLRGMAKRDGDAWVVTFHELVPGDAEPAEEPARRKRRR
ncbi:MAG: hypothetical protein AMXMBFR64_11540 [Myxococcales bacterium]